jgi:3-oxoacyl-[acyl-carrier-protein] synthase-1
VRGGGAPVITATAAITPVGHNAAQSCAAVRAGIARIGEHPFYRPELADPPLGEREHARAGCVTGIGAPATAAERLLALALFPVKELIAAARLRRADLARATLHLCLPSRAGGRPEICSAEDLATQFLDRLEWSEIDRAPVRQEGSSAMIAAAAKATAQIAAGETSLALVAGVDSYFDDATMRALDQAGRLRSERNVDGFIPGEAAVMLVLESDAGARASGADILARVTGFGEGHEPRAITSERFSTGAGLAAAIERALAGRTNPRGELWPIGDLNGESYRAQEWGLMLSRLDDCLGTKHSTMAPLWHPASSTGDVGAASGGLQMALACHGFMRENALSDTALIWCASDGGERAACVLEDPRGSSV